MIAQYCNTLNGEQVISSGENLYIDFMVDGTKQSQGFAATFEFVSEDKLKLPEVRPPIIPTKTNKTNSGKHEKHVIINYITATSIN